MLSRIVSSTNGFIRFHSANGGSVHVLPNTAHIRAAMDKRATDIKEVRDTREGREVVFHGEVPPELTA